MPPRSAKWFQADRGASPRSAQDHALCSTPKNLLTCGKRTGNLRDENHDENRDENWNENPGSRPRLAAPRKVRKPRTKTATKTSSKTATKTATKTGTKTRILQNEPKIRAVKKFPKKTRKTLELNRKRVFDKNSYGFRAGFRTGFRTSFRLGFRAMLFSRICPLSK